ncbi:ubiquitin carboxyl-terminal hydrolase MINDY-2 [Rhinoderma darwinii]|uniref:ubiquitin carboxyl-terminal hydrolase MINDY-2 n=1 Tax=Rhinoderma darwinii TaxID=43563 RepID=UPI003F679C5C
MESPVIAAASSGTVLVESADTVASDTVKTDVESAKPVCPGDDSLGQRVPAPSSGQAAAAEGQKEAVEAQAWKESPGGAVSVATAPTSGNAMNGSTAESGEPSAVEIGLAAHTLAVPAALTPEEPSSSGQSIPGCSQSLDSLESFSNLISCPSSELNSEGAEEEEDAKEAQAARDRFPGQSVYHIKWIRWKEQSTPIVTQNENGPCPLLAIMNALLLAWKVKLPPMMEIITVEQLMEYLGDYILEAKPKEISEAQRLNYEQNMSDAMAILHKLQTGLDVNVKFTGVRVFEYTPECIVFDLLDMPLYHGWLLDPEIAKVVTAVGNCSYNQLVEKIISFKQSDNSELVSEGLVAEQFLNGTATQLTFHGLSELTSTLQEGELCVFFRNNHFSTMTKYKGLLYLLVTDQGFLTEENIVWESLHNVDGDGNFCNSDFHLRPPSEPETVYQGQQDQIDQDYLMALSLQQEQQNQDIDWEQIPEGISDLDLAKKLQEEEDRRASQYYQEQEQAAASAPQQPGQPPQAIASPSSGRTPGSSEKKRKEPKEKEKDKNSCILL